MKKSSKHVWKASWRRLEDVLEDEVLLLQRRLQGVSKTSWKTKNVWWVRRIYYFVIKKYFLKEKFFQKVFLFKKILFLLHVIINILTRHWKKFVNPYKTMYFAITAIKQAVACGMFYLAYWLKGKVCNLTKTLSPYSN